jgi:hypothetical protein
VLFICILSNGLCAIIDRAVRVLPYPTISPIIPIFVEILIECGIFLRLASLLYELFWYVIEPTFSI